MWLQVFFLCLSVLSLSSQAQDRASFRRSNDQSGQCHYTFSVASPEESSCPGGGLKPEVDGVQSRLTVLEALVSRLLAGGDGGAGATPGAVPEAGGAEGLEEAYAQVMGEKNQLQEDKEQLNRQVLELQRRLDELSQEAETLRQRPCQLTHSSGAPGRENRPASGRCIRTRKKPTKSIISIF